MIDWIRMLFYSIRGRGTVDITVTRCRILECIIVSVEFAPQKLILEYWELGRVSGQRWYGCICQWIFTYVNSLRVRVCKDKCVQLAPWFLIVIRAPSSLAKCPEQAAIRSSQPFPAVKQFCKFRSDQRSDASQHGKGNPTITSHYASHHLEHENEWVQPTAN